MNVLEQHEVSIGENRYMITAMDASYGLAVMNKMAEFGAKGENPGADFIKGVVLKSVTHNNKAVDAKWFDKHFSRKYKELNELFAKIIEFNFGEFGEDGPNAEGGTSGK